MFKAACVLCAPEQSFSGALQVAFLKRLGDTVHQFCSSFIHHRFVSLCHSRQTDDDQITSQKSHRIITINA